MYKLRNYMEILVDQMFDTATRGIDVCKCEKCTLDIKAIALNELKPRYIVADDTELYIKMNLFQQQFHTDIIAALTKGTMLVASSARHD